MDKDTRLGILASAILDGTPVDWHAARLDSRGDERGSSATADRRRDCGPSPASRRGPALAGARTERSQRSTRPRIVGAPAAARTRRPRHASARCIAPGIRTSIARSRSSCSARPPLSHDPSASLSDPDARRQRRPAPGARAPSARHHGLRRRTARRLGRHLDGVHPRPHAAPDRRAARPAGRARSDGRRHGPLSRAGRRCTAPVCCIAT